MLDLFHAFVIVHIVFGATGLVAFWVPVVGRKGDRRHRRWGRVFTYTMLATGATAVCIAVTTLVDPVATHPRIAGTWDPALIRGIFGWMMLYLAILTVNLAWYGWQCVRNGRAVERNREWRNLALQALLLVAAANCAWHGAALGQPLMMGISVVGFATVGTNLWFLYGRPGPTAWLREHVKGLVGTGISVYTAFLAFGAVRTFPQLALHPVLWAVPLVVGVSIILYQWRAIARQAARQAALQASRRTGPPAPAAGA
jgi:hypothetical protein